MLPREAVSTEQITMEDGCNKKVGKHYRNICPIEDKKDHSLQHCGLQGARIYRGTLNGNASCKVCPPHRCMPKSESGGSSKTKLAQVDKCYSCTDLSTVISEYVGFFGRINLYGRMGNCQMRVNFVLLRNLVVFDLLGEPFIERFVKRIYPAEQKVVPYSSTQVLILTIMLPTSDDDP